MPEHFIYGIFKDWDLIHQDLMYEKDRVKSWMPSFLVDFLLHEVLVMLWWRERPSLVSLIDTSPFASPGQLESTWKL